MFLQLEDRKFELADIESSTDNKFLEDSMQVIANATIRAEQHLAAHILNKNTEKAAACRSFIKRCKFFKQTILLRIGKIGNLDKWFRAAAKQILDTKTYQEIERKALENRKNA
jgi:hypothetical protein